MARAYVKKINVTISASAGRLRQTIKLMVFETLEEAVAELGESEALRFLNSGFAKEIKGKVYTKISQRGITP